MVKIVKIKGGLGNQMFGYAFSLMLKKKHSSSIILLDLIDSWYAHNGHEISKVFKHLKFHSYLHYRVLRRIYTTKHIRGLFTSILEPTKHNGAFRAEYLKDSNMFSIYDGFWQTEKYFKPIEQKLRKKFKFNFENLNQKSLEYLKIIQEKSSVSIHIRRGDYLLFQDTFDICTKEYYSKAKNYLESKYNGLTYFIFTDDLEWTTKYFNLSGSYIIACNQGVDSWQDMCLMSNCKHNIIANSTFSWWGGWLNQNKNKTVIAPLTWMNNIDAPDIIPDSWFRI